jgi:hypothetical protein
MSIKNLNAIPSDTIILHVEIYSIRIFATDSLKNLS